LPTEGEIFLLTNDGKAKRVDQKEFPSQGRYGKGVRVWDLPGKSKLAGIASGKDNHMATIHLSKGAPKSTRLDAVAIRKRASSKGDLVVEVKPGEEVASINVGWMVDRFVVAEKKQEAKKKKEAKASAKPKPAPAKKAAKVKPSKPKAKKK
jgi:DNA gyrase/topoisomerase IV subunit A